MKKWELIIDLEWMYDSFVHLRFIKWFLICIFIYTLHIYIHIIYIIYIYMYK